jgi:tRNA-dihydrouridine synthase
MNAAPLILAPLRGFTDVIFRNTFQNHFGGVDEAVAPFVTAVKGRRIKAAHLRELEPVHNRAMPTVPQVLGNDPDELIRLVNALGDMGYPEINWNLGCPFAMVAKKKRGSGLLPHPDAIDHVLEQVLAGFAGRLSVKTRLGRFSAAEMDRLIPVFNRYPLARVIVHPRTGVQMYTGTVDLAAFQKCLAALVHPVVYNGDINDTQTFYAHQQRFSGVAGWMLGRGLIANPFLAEMIRQGTTALPGSRERFTRFHDDLLDGYGGRFCGPGHLLDRMKGFWRYFASGFGDGRRILTRIRRAGSLDRYRREVAAALADHGGWSG